jgi:DNA-binding protein HU-beta
LRGHDSMSSPKAMTKSEIISHLSEKMNSSKVSASEWLEHLTALAIRETKKSGVFILPGLGKLVKAHRKARVGRNPQNGEAIKIPAKTVLKFRIAKAAKDAIVPSKAAA